MSERPACGATPGERVLIALEACASKLASLGRTFSSTNFTDRYGDGPACLALAKHAREVLDESRTRSESALKACAASGIYVASRVKQAEVWKSYRARGWKINSTWIDEAGEGETADFGALWERIRDEIARSHCLVFYASGLDDFPFKGAFVEVGMALAMGKRVLVALENVTLEGRTMRPVGSWLLDRKVHRFDTLEEAMDVARGVDILCNKMKGPSLSAPSAGERTTEALPGPESPLAIFREWAEDYCNGKELQRVLMEQLLERFIVLADEKLSAPSSAPVATDAISERIEALVVECNMAGYTRKGNELQNQIAGMREALDIVKNAAATPCCGDFSNCHRACTPRGEWNAEQRSSALPAARLAPVAWRYREKCPDGRTGLWKISSTEVIARDPGEGNGWEVQPLFALSASGLAIEDVREALRPFVFEFRRHGERYEKAKSDWFKKMPGHFPVALGVTMDDGRRAEALLSKLADVVTAPDSRRDGG